MAACLTSPSLLGHGRGVQRIGSQVIVDDVVVVVVVGGGGWCLSWSAAKRKAGGSCSPFSPLPPSPPPPLPLILFQERWHKQEAQVGGSGKGKKTEKGTNTEKSQVRT